MIYHKTHGFLPWAADRAQAEGLFHVAALIRSAMTKIEEMESDAVCEGCALRPSGINSHRVITDETYKAMADDYASGDMMSSQIAKKYNVAKATVVKAARMFGVPVRPSGINSARGIV